VSACFELPMRHLVEETDVLARLRSGTKERSLGRLVRKVVKQFRKNSEIFAKGDEDCAISRQLHRVAAAVCSLSASKQCNSCAKYMILRKICDLAQDV